MELRILGPYTLGRAMDLAQTIEEEIVIANSSRVFGKFHGTKMNLGQRSQASTNVSQTISDGNLITTKQAREVH